MSINEELVQRIGALERRLEALEAQERAASGIGARVTKSGAQGIGNDISVTLDWETERWDTDDMHDTVTNPSRLTINTPGKYLVWGQVVWAANNTGTRQIHFRVNGATDHMRTLISAIGATAHSAVVVLDLVVDDYVEMRVRQTSGGLLNIQKIDPRAPEFGIQLIG